MTISSLTTRVDYTGDDASTEFAVPFQFFLPSDLTVIERDSTTGAETALTLNTDYTVAGGDNALGTVTLSAPAPSGTSLVILRDTLRVQETDYVDYDAFPAESHEQAIDRLTMQTQELDREVQRRLALRRTDPITQALLPTKESRANKILGFDADGAPIAVSVNGEGNVIIDEDMITTILNNYLSEMFPVGMVIMWAGAIVDIPDGWALCDGTNGTPNLRDRFVVGAGSTYGVGATGGAASVTTSSGGAHTHGGATGSTALTVAQLPVHKHSMGSTVVRNVGTGGTITGVGNYADGASETENQGSGEAHSHTITSGGAHDHTAATLPPYYALAYIMRVGSYITVPSGEIGTGVIPASVRSKSFQFACGDETTAIDAAATDVITLRALEAMTLTGVRASLNGACTTGTFEVDVLVNGVSILSTPLTIDAGEKTSVTALVPAVLATTSLADNAEITVDIVDEGDGTAFGLKVALLGVVPA